MLSWKLWHRYARWLLILILGLWVFERVFRTPQLSESEQDIADHLEALGPVAKAELRAAFTEYEQLNAIERQEIDALFAKLQQLPVEERAALESTMWSYFSWVRTLSPSDREALQRRDLPAAERLALVRQLRDKQQAVANEWFLELVNPSEDTNEPEASDFSEKAAAAYCERLLTILTPQLTPEENQAMQRLAHANTSIRLLFILTLDARHNGVGSAQLTSEEQKTLRQIARRLCFWFITQSVAVMRKNLASGMRGPREMPWGGGSLPFPYRWDRMVGNFLDRLARDNKMDGMETLYSSLYTILAHPIDESSLFEFLNEHDFWQNQLESHRFSVFNRELKYVFLLSFMRQAPNANELLPPKLLADLRKWDEIFESLIPKRPFGSDSR